MRALPALTVRAGAFAAVAAIGMLAFAPRPVPTSAMIFSPAARIDCPGCNLQHAELKRRDLTGANLEGANLTNATLHEANISNANLLAQTSASAVLNLAIFRRNRPDRRRHEQGARLRRRFRCRRMSRGRP